MKWAIDFSSYDARQASGAYKPMNWSASGLDMAIIKAGEGIYKDPAFAMQWAAAKGIPRVAYHFFRSNVNATNQAHGFLSSVLPDFISKDYLAVDFETQDKVNGGTCLGYLSYFLHELEKSVSFTRILIYTYPAFWNMLGGSHSSWAAKYGLWLAQWPRDTYIASLPVKIFNGQGLARLKSDVELGVLKPMFLAPWKSPSIWQFTSRADTRFIPGYTGIKKVCDYNAVFMPLP